MRLLVVDDAEIIRELIKDTVAEIGWETVGEASNGKEAVEKYKELSPDAVTLDMVMPEADGLEALQGIRTIDPTAHVLMVSAVEHAAVLKKALQSGAADFIVKPFEKKRLQSALSKIQDRKKSVAM